MFAATSEEEPSKSATAEDHPCGNKKSFRFHVVERVVVLEGKIL